MRSKATNFLQVVVLISGILYILLGSVFYISPMFFARLSGITVPEDWFTQIRYDTFVAPLYFISRSYGALVCTIGIAMVLPLFDPLRYRGLIYFAGVVFPLLGAIMCIQSGVRYNHNLLLTLGIVFAIILVVTAIGLFYTKKIAQSGRE